MPTRKKKAAGESTPGANGRNARASLFDRAKKGLEEALAHSRGDEGGVVVHHPPDEVDVAAIRKRARLTQDAFAKRFGFTLDSVQNWEAKRKKPSGAARVLLTIIDREPDAVMRALEGR